MKNQINQLIYIFTLFFIVSCSTNKKLILESENYKKLQENVENKSYLFQPNFIIPTGEIQSKYLSPGYYVSITKEEILVNLPYLGMTTGANFDGRLTGYDFTSTNFTHNIKLDKKNNWLVDIKINDYKEKIEMTIKISPNGKSTLTILSFSRQPITFTGKIE